MAQGGTDLVAVKERSVYTLAPQHNRWTPHPDNPISYPEDEDVEDICFCSVPGGLFGMGGRNKQTGNVSKKCYYFNGQTHQWEPKPDMINARHSASAAVLGNEILVVGGETSLVNPEERNRGESFNFVDLVWHSLRSLVKPSMRLNQLLDAPMLKPLVASAAGILFVVPRQDIDNIHPDDICMQQFKPGDNSFVNVQLPFDFRERTCACLVAFEDMLYLISGVEGKVFRHNPVSVTHQWTVLTQGNPQLPRGCSALAVEVEGGSSNILVCGRGRYGMDVFHPQTPEWRPYISLPFPAAGDSNLTLPFEFDWKNSYVFSM